MSGRKKSDFELRRERAEKLNLLQRVMGLCNQAVGLRQDINERVAAVSEGLRTTFAREIARASSWAKQTAPESASLSMDSDTAALQQTQQRLEQFAKEGLAAQQQLQLTLTQKADQFGQRLTTRLAEARGEYLARRELIGQWFPEIRQRTDEQFRQAEKMLQEEHYSKLDPLLGNLHGAITKAGSESESLESQHQKRMYLLKALRQVCQDMGMKEVSTPQFESSSQRGSKINLQVDTINHGHIKFSLALDGISSFAGTEQQTHCFHDFGRLSRHLEEQFGIQTKFRTEAGEEIPEDRARNELDLPEDTGLEATD